MRTRLSRLRMRDLALFVVVAGVVAVAAVFGAREAGLGDRSAVAEGESLTLTLSTQQQVCETERARRSGVVESYKDEDGNWVERETIFGWYGIPSVAVRWHASGGQAPYTMVIDGEAADEHHAYEGPSGTALVGCADASVGTSFWPDEGRMYAVDPQVDSGWKTVRAVVIDANGDTANAMVQFYTLLDLGGGTTGEILRRGETYRILGILMTAPQNYDIRVGGIAERECAENDPDPRCGDTTHGFSLVGAKRRAS